MKSIFKYWNKEQKERIIKLLNIVFETAEEINEETNDKNRNNKSDSIRTSNREDSLQD